MQCFQRDDLFGSSIEELGYGGRNRGPATILADNEAALDMASNPVKHQRAKHIDVACYYVQNIVEMGAARLKYMLTDQMVVDGLTKPPEPCKSLTFG